MFLESICTADEIVESNVREVKVHSPDYKVVLQKVPYEGS